MSIRVMADVWDSELKGDTATHVMLVLANSADDDGTNCFPGTQLIARRSRVSERTVIRTIKSLEKEGWISVTQRGLGRGHRTEYRLNVKLLHAQAERTRAERHERKRRHGVSFSLDKQKVTSTNRKGEDGAANADAGDLPLYVLPVNESSSDPIPPHPLLPEGIEVEIERAVDQVCSALAISDVRMRSPVKSAILLAMENGEPASAIALDIIAAVRNQDRLHMVYALKYKFGLRKFLGQGIWRDDKRWAWNPEELTRQGEARAGTFG